MIEIVLLILFSGFVLSLHRGMGVANPFGLYFGVWFIVVFAYYLTDGTYIELSEGFVFLFLLANFLAFGLLVYEVSRGDPCRKKTGVELIVNTKYLGLAQLLTLCALPFAYVKALELSQGLSVFTSLGYVQLRLALTEENQSFGWLSYVGLLSFVVVSLRASISDRKFYLDVKLWSAVLVGLFYCYLGTGRTYFLLFGVMVVVPLVLLDKIGAKSLAASFFLFCVAFVFVAAMTGKGFAIDAGTNDNIESFLKNLRGYLVAPFVALSNLVDKGAEPSFGINTFRTLISVLAALNLSEIKPVPLIREYAEVPDLTNVYTVFEVYFLDFSYVGFLIPPLFLVMHSFLYKKALRSRGVFVFIYAASVYPLLMQFFQDQYMTLLSMWLQIGFWYWLLIDSRSNKKTHPLNVKSVPEAV